MTQTQQKAPLWQYLSIIVLVLLIGGLWLFAENFNLMANNPPGQLASPDCDITQQSCTASGSGIAITLDVPSKIIQSMQPIDFKVTVDGIQAEGVLVDLQGTEMYMGINQTELETSSDIPGLFTGQGELGVCVTGEMGWRATVLVNTQQGDVKAHYNFRAK